jgi:hypothetical protein
VIAPGPSLRRTKTPAFNRGMNSKNEWTVLREPMCFYGVAYVGATVSADFMPAGADRLIGV